MIPNSNNINNNNQIKIQLTNDDKCIIQTISESPFKSQNTIIKDNFSLNEDMSLSKSNSIINNNSKLKQKISNSNLNNNNTIFNDLENSSKILLSFSNISDVTKFNNDLSMTRRNSYKDSSIIINKEKNLISNKKNEKEKQSYIKNKIKKRQKIKML